MLRATNITCKVGDKILLDNVSVEFQAGKFNMVMGPNGAGKSTLIKVLSHKENPSEGKVFYGDEAATEFTASNLAKIRSVLSQNNIVTFPLRVAEVVMMGRYPHFTNTPSSRDTTACEEALRYFDSWDMRERNFNTLSGGEKQRVQFARVLAQIWHPAENGYRYLFLDEPLTFLDIRYQIDLMNKLKEMLQKQDLVLVGVVHDINLAAHYADHVVLLREGRVLASGAKESVMTKENIEAAFGISPILLHYGSKMFVAFD